MTSPSIRVLLSGDARSYEIHVAPGLLDRVGEEAAALGLSGRAAIVTQPKVRRLYASRVARSLKGAGFDPRIIEIPDGEAQKNLRSASRLYDEFLKMGMERGSPVFALGGGVVGDLAGYAAATYLRGVPLVMVPTTVVAQVDASIGGKVGVDHRLGKNLIGAFYQPRLVLADPLVLATLPAREIRGGLAEAVKYGVIADPDLFAFLEKEMVALLKAEGEPMAQVVRRSASIKAGIVEKDEREGGLRRILNYGHTLGHALETLGRYRRWTHGEAIAIGMVAAARLSRRLALCDEETVDRQRALLSALHLPTEWPRLPVADIISVVARDKKVARKIPHFVLAEGIGRVTVRPVEVGILKKFLAEQLRPRS